MKIDALVQEVHRRREGRGLVLFLDYDGTLVDIAPGPEEAVPTPEVLDILSRLTAHPDITVVVISGRPLKELQNFLPLAGLRSVGSHGGEGRLNERHWDKSPTTGPAGEPARWAQDIKSRLAGLNGWRLEQKPLGVAVHYRRAEPDQAACIRERLTAWAQEVVNSGPWEVMWGRKVLEVLPQGVSKGAAIQDILSTAFFSDLYPIYLGDDTTDESAFEALQGMGLTIKVGAAGGATAADHFLADPAAVLAFLASLALLPKKASSP